MENTEKIMSIEEVVKAVSDKITPELTANTKAEFTQLRKEMAEQNLKTIVPQLEGTTNDGEGRTFAGSIVDFSRCKGVSPVMSDAEVGMSFVTQGGFFRKLSPALELFAQSIRSKGRNFDPTKLIEACQKQMTQLNLKTATGIGEANAGFQIPVEYPAMCIEAAVATSPILSKIWRFPMNEGSVSIPKLSQSDSSYFGGVSTTWSGVASSGEGSTMTPTNPSFSYNLFQAKKCTQLVVLTDELIQDSPINILNYVTGLLVRKFQYELERVIIAGNGTTEPTGIITDTTVIANAVARTTAGTVKYADLIKVDGQLNEIFNNPSLLTRKLTLATLRAEVDSSQRPIWYESYNTAMATGTAQREIPKLGMPFHVTRNCPAIGSIGDVIIGELGMYMLGMRLDMRIDISDAPGFVKNETYVRFISRADGMPGTSFAFKILKAATS